MFLVVADDVRAVRRRLDEAASSRTVAVDTVREALTQRDRADASLGRALRAQDAAPDALVVDTTNSTVDEVVAAIVERVRAAERDDEVTP